jgi:hypothetical protein
MYIPREDGATEIGFSLAGITELNLMGPKSTHKNDPFQIRQYCASIYETRSGGAYPVP